MREIVDTANPSHTRLQEEEDLDSTKLAQYEVDIRAKNLLLLGLSDEIYNTIYSNQTTHGLWQALERLMQGADVGVQINKLLLCGAINPLKQNPMKPLKTHTSILTNS